MNACILVVDDDSFLLQLNARLLRKAGYEVIEAATGQDGLRLAQAHKPDLVLLDVMLPDITGLEVCQQIKTNPALANTFVVLLSASKTDSESQAEGLEGGADGYIARPVSNRELLARLEALLRLKQAETALRESEERYRLVSELTSDFAYAIRVEPDGGLVLEWVTGAFNRITHFTAAELSEQGSWETLIYPDDRAIAYQHFQTLLSGQMDACVLRIIAKDGEVRWLRNYGRPVWDEKQQRITFIYGAARDVTARQQAEMKLNRANRTLKVLSEVNQALLRTTAEAELLNDICRIVTEIGGYRLAWVGIAEQDETKRVRPIAQAGYEAGYLETVNITWDNTEHGQGPSGTAIRTGQPSVVRNILSDPSYAPWRVEASQRGYASTIALPLLSADKPFGVLNIYAAEPDAFDAEEVKLLTELAWDLAFGMTALRTRVEHQRTLEMLHYQKTLLECQTEAAPEGILIVSDDHEWLTYNRRFVEMWGAPAELVEDGSRKEKLQWVMQHVLNPQAFVNKVKYLYQHKDEQSHDEIVLKDGRIFDRFSAPVISATGVHYGRVWYYRDVTARKRAEEELSRREEEFRLIFEYSNDAIFWADVSTGRIINCNRKAEELLERTRPQIIGLHQSELHPPGEAESYVAKFQQATAQATSADIEAELYSASGKRIPVLISTSVVQIGDRAIIQGIFHDITERKQAEEQINWLAKLPAENPNPVLRIKQDGVILYANKASSSLLNLWACQINQKIPAGWAKIVTEALASGAIQEAELSLGDRTLSLTFAPIAGSDYVNLYGLDITERKRAEQAVRDNEERFRLLAENAQDIIYRIRFWPQFGFEYVSPAATVVTGYTPEEHYADPYLGFKLVHPDDQPVLESIKDSPQSYQEPMILRWIRKDGRVIWTEQRNVPLFDGQGRLVALQGIARDITERKRIEEALKLEEMRLNSLLELSQKAHELSEKEIIQFTLEEAVKFTQSAIGYLHFVNPDQTTIQLITWSKGTLETCTAAHDSHYPLDQAGVWADCARFRRPVVHNDYQNLADKKGYPLGHTPIVRHLSVPVMDGDKVAIIMGVGNKAFDYDEADVRQMLLTADHLWKIVRRKRAEDELKHYRDRLEERVTARTVELTQANQKLHREIVERQLIESTLRESEVRFRTVADFTYDWEYWLGTDGDLIYVSPSCKRITGYGPDEFQKEPELMRLIVHPEDQELFARHLWAEGTSKAVPNLEFRIVTRTGHERWIGHVCQPVYGTGGRWLGRRASNRDITEQKQMQTQLKEYAQHLEKLVADKVQELELERAKTIQVAKMVALGEMATGVAHELNQPLTAMLFEADYLKKLSQKMSEDPSAAVPLNGNELFQIGENLGRDIARCRRIIDHLRDFGRVSSNHPSSVNLNQPILDSFILVGEQLKNHSVVVQMDLNPALPFIAAEPHKLEQIFLNLINNAEYALMEMEQRVQAGVIEWPNYQKTLAISTHFEQGYVVATVRDNGCGLSALAKEHLFEPFFTTKPIGQGTGLGLSISYSIVREFDGEISYESSENAGATFTVRFPALGY